MCTHVWHTTSWNFFKEKRETPGMRWKKQRHDGDLHGISKRQEDSKDG
jgi:hypothetical protein